MRRLVLLLAVAVSLVAAAQPANHRGGARLDKSADTVLTQMIASELPKFRQLVFHDELTGKELPYNLYVPQDYSSNKTYPLVLFMGDASTAGANPQRPLAQGWGGLVWATQQEQAKHPSFVLVPGFTSKAVDDDWSTTDEVEMTVRLLDKVCGDYSIDRKRLYTTGQSMGGMISFYLNITHPHLFAASLFVGSQWDTSKMAPFIGNKFFYVVAAGDQKAPKGMEALERVLNQHGVQPAKGEWSAKLPARQQNENVEAMLAKGNDINFITFTKGSVLPESGMGNEHMNSFDYAYKLGAVRDWLFRQRLDSYAKTSGLAVWANDGDWHGDNITPLMAIKKAIDKGAQCVVFGVEKNSNGQLVLVSDHDNTSTPVLLADAISLAMGRIKIALKLSGAISYSEDFKQLSAQQQKTLILIGNENKIGETQCMTVVNLDKKSWKKQLNNALNSQADYVELIYGKDDSQLDAAIDYINSKGSAQVLVNTTAAGLAGRHSDATMRGINAQVWSELRARGISGIITNEIKPLLNWLKK